QGEKGGKQIEVDAHGRALRTIPRKILSQVIMSI
ncbi:unnamed protein product, partial [marine sediment metagenome]